MESTKKNRKYLTIAIAVPLFINLAYFVHAGVLLGGDSGFYLKNAESILQNGIRHYIDTAARPYYWGYPTFVAIFGSFGGNISIVIAQILLAIFAHFLIFKIVFKITENSLSALLCCCLYAIQFDVFDWNPFILSDSLGMSMEVITLYLFYRIWLPSEKQESTWLSVLLFVLSAFVFFTVRTNAASLILPLVILLLVKGVKDFGIQPFAATAIFIGIVVTVIGLMLLASSHSDGSVHNFSARIDWAISQYSDGKIIDGRNRLDYHPAGVFGWKDALIVILLRCKYYFSLWFADQSTIHKLVGTITILPIWILSAISTVFVIQGKRREYYPVMFGALSYFVIQVLISVDFDMRYRAPIFAPLVILISCGLEGIKNHFKPKKDLNKASAENADFEAIAKNGAK